MIIEIKLSKRVRLKNRECYGLTVFKKKKINIYVSETCRDITQFSLTLIHELLHVWLEVIKLNGAKIDLRKSHKFIFLMESNIIKALKTIS